MVDAILRYSVYPPIAPFVQFSIVVFRDNDPSIFNRYAHAVAGSHEIRNVVNDSGTWGYKRGSSLFNFTVSLADALGEIRTTSLDTLW